MVGADEIYLRLNEIKEGTKYLRGLTLKKLEDRDTFLLGRYHLQIILEAMFTIGNQLIANKGYRKPENYRDILNVLTENGVIAGSLQKQLDKFAELRNRIVHAYWKISKKELLKIIESDLGRFTAFQKSILKHI